MSKDRERFHYQPRGADSAKKRAQQSGGAFDPLFKSNFSVVKIKEGDYRFRFMPPTWEAAEHFGLDIYVHYGIGADDGAYLCLEKNVEILKALGLKEEECPICAERRQALKDKDDEYAKELNPTKRVVVWLIDRDDEDAGPQLWSMPWTIDRDFGSLSVDKRSGETLLLDDPENGYDAEFSRTGKGKNTKYIGVQVARRSTPLCDDEKQQDKWLQFITDNPLPETLNFFDAEYIAGVFGGGGRADKGDDAPRGRRSSRDDPAPEEAPRGRRSSREDEPSANSRSRGRDDPEDLPPDDERPRSMRGDDEPAPRSRRSSRDDPEPEERPSRRGTATADANDDPPPRRRSSRDEPAGSADDGDIPPKGARTSRGKKDEEEATPPRRRERLRGANPDEDD
jgi:hypothetical protein